MKDERTDEREGWERLALRLPRGTRRDIERAAKRLGIKDARGVAGAVVARLVREYLAGRS